MSKTDSKIKALSYYIADGTFCTNEWYRDLDNPNESTNVSEFVEVRTTTASSSNNLFENVEDRSIEIECVDESHNANKSSWYDDDSSPADDNDALETILTF